MAVVFDKPGVKVKLDELDCEPPKNISREEAQARLDKLGDELFQLQNLMWGARSHGVLVVLQGRDTAGKDGVIKKVAGCLNPRGVQVVSFGVPTVEELQHDFLWRVHQRAPRKGEFAIFNRSHYEDVLVVRVHDLVPKEVWRERYDHIVAFERLLGTEGTVVLKFFLHITRGEQKQRLLEREVDAINAWKLSLGDWKERELWEQYTDAYEKAISHTATPEAPWTVVPANAKWYRNLVVAEAIVSALRPLEKGWRNKLEAEGERMRAELEVWRQKKK
jgi:PPK2 family polyphosphate:nucleotide phosphotransferase